VGIRLRDGLDGIQGNNRAARPILESVRCLAPAIQRRIDVCSKLEWQTQKIRPGLAVIEHQSVNLNDNPSIKFIDHLFTVCKIRRSVSPLLGFFCVTMLSPQIRPITEIDSFNQQINVFLYGYPRV
jgi:hypothetical protein